MYSKYKSYCTNKYDPHVLEWLRPVPGELAGLYLKWWGVAHWAVRWKLSVWHHDKCVCVCVCVRVWDRELVCVQKRDTSQRACAPISVILHHTCQSACACKWSCFVCMTIYCIHSFVCGLTYVYVHSHMTISVCVCLCVIVREREGALNISSVLLSNYIHNSNLNVQGPWWMCHPSVTCS